MGYESLKVMLKHGPRVQKILLMQTMESKPSGGEPPQQKCSLVQCLHIHLYSKWTKDTPP